MIKMLKFKEKSKFIFWIMGIYMQLVTYQKYIFVLNFVMQTKIIGCFFLINICLK